MSIFKQPGHASLLCRSVYSFKLRFIQKPNDFSNLMQNTFSLVMKSVDIFKYRNFYV